MTLKTLLRLLKKLILSPVRRLWNFLIDYTGFGAPFVKAISVVLMLIVMAYPWWSYPLWLSLAQSVTLLQQYVIYVVWLSQWLIVIIVAAAIGYVMENR